MNTVAQVLRHTPGFVENVRELARGVEELKVMNELDEAVSVLTLIYHSEYYCNHFTLPSYTICIQ